ncbi:transcriptional regulator NrdR [Candidatus Neomarinimicrobiota bacterium]
MLCPYCHSNHSKVVDSRTVSRDGSIRRRRECLECENRFTTYEYVLKQPLLVVKKNGQRVDYDRQRLERSIRLATNKRPVSAEQINDAVSIIHSKILDLAKAEISSMEIGEMVMEILKDLDKVAFIRFASVYREFEDIGAFKAEIDQLQG